jgi:hypothetical protein
MGLYCKACVVINKQKTTGKVVLGRRESNPKPLVICSAMFSGVNHLTISFDG